MLFFESRRGRKREKRNERQKRKDGDRGAKIKKERETPPATRANDK